MFPATELNVAQHQAGWLNRIMQSQSRHVATPVDNRRTFTPLRPNAALVSRVPTPLAAAAAGGGSRPSTQQAQRTQPDVAVPQQPNSARGAPPRLPSLKDGGLGGSHVAHSGAAAAMGSSSVATTPQRNGVKAAVTPLRSSTLLMSIPDVRTPSTSHLSPEARSALITTTKDAHSQHEGDVVDEINQMRRDPNAYGRILEAELRVAAPFLVPDAVTGFLPAPENLAGLINIVKTSTKALADSRALLAQLESGEAKEIAAMREAWAAEDAERAKKKGKAPAPKKAAGGGADVKEKTQEDIEAEREAEIAALVQRNATSRTETKERIASLTVALDRAQKGVDTVELLVAKLLATPPLPALEMNRGLSLAARDMADAEINGSVGVDPHIYTARYGGGEGPLQQCLTIGRKDPRTTVLDLLLSLPDPRRGGRHALLNPAMRLIGCGWRRHPTHIASTAVILAGNYAEYSAIAQREHLPLQDIRRTLPFATRISTNIRVRLDVPRDAGIEVVEPASHPVNTSKKLYRAVVRCPHDTLICAAVCRRGEPEPKKPSFVAGGTFVQRTASGDGVEVFAAFPTDGQYNIVLYGALPSSLTSPFNSTQKTLAGSISDVTAADAANDILFKRLGAISVVVDDSNPNTPVPTFPVASVDFHERRCRVANATQGVLRPDTEYTFTLQVPHTQYKADELRRVEASLQAAVQKTETSRSTTAALEAQVAEAIAKIAQAEAEEKTVAPTLQSEIAALQKDMAKKKGKELDKAKASVTELEEKLAGLSQLVQKAIAARQAAEEKLNAHRRNSRQASAMRRRYLADKQQLVTLTDRSKPLDVEMSVDERRAKFTPLAGDGTTYAVRIRTPAEGRLTVFVSGVAAITYDVLREATDWPAETDPSEW